MARPSHYTEKFAAIAAGSPQDLTAGEFLRHVLVGQGNNRFNHKKIIHLFERALGYSEGHLSSNVLNARGALPQRIQQHLTEITKSDAYFWAKDRYSSAEAQQVSSVLNAYIDQLLKDAAQERDTLTSLQKALKERNSTDTPAR